MKIRVLGCAGAMASGHRTTSFLLDDDVLIDAGSGVGELPLDAMARVDRILITHSHLDHVLSIGLLADAVQRRRAQAGRPPIQVHALPETLDALRKHIFNGVIWPDFTRLPSVERPALTFHAFAVGERLDLGRGRCIEVLSAAHTVPAVGFALDGGEAGYWVFTGDTGPNPALWRRLSELKLAHLVIECAFGDEECGLAGLSKHHCPRTLGAELTRLAGSVQVHITHIKPGERAAVMAAVDALRTVHRVSALENFQEFELSEAVAQV
ncbi:MBL fold metallo-hydrolase [Roseateles amylovorans]|uniref:3',5'-cyclic-nucleotide phosphodiesterase n=1 Tax=Roseateles amylovorans TaxID=2978473 RepID=A0ABY6AZ42_9BURK|nr:3',5'-cyclic-nucleotide phosphodiesterase [Roseateles amylovorans]UXH78187.1 3',5'-cyclic-nucleotide phosphodiesterase [Roseateles amylovorans]